MHDTAHAIFSHAQQGSQFAVAKRIIHFMPLLDGESHLPIFLRLLGGPIERGSPHMQSSRDLALGVGAMRLTQLVGQFYLLRRF
ncbi:hypothetical protein [Ktedonospora formicarum]|uniref:hypothetical protein n=1 Tax=Ktedonospora formicarum TaxID=2778364 RepID=UPI001F33B327|nr:hypothetical protein [Ktedonospora formicarum]